jgi:chorismate-pyruvate lyase
VLCKDERPFVPAGSICRLETMACDHFKHRTQGLVIDLPISERCIDLVEGLKRVLEFASSK